MKIDITRKEYRALLDILAIADWVFSSHEVEEDEETEEFRSLEQKLFSYAKGFGFDHLIEYDREFERYFPTDRFDGTSKCDEIMEKFEDEVFWEELIRRLVERDLLRQAGSRKNLMNMPIEETIEKEDDLETMYRDEFEANGLEHLEITGNRRIAH
jgi:hypothetical protein